LSSGIHAFAEIARKGLAVKTPHKQKGQQA
jgi:hypothetical protein